MTGLYNVDKAINEREGNDMENLKTIFTENQKLYVQLQNESKEVVSVEDAVLAYTIVKSLKYNSVTDFYLGGASLNLLNTYVKQKDTLIDYRFKVHTKELIETLANKDIDNIRMDLQKDKGMKLLVIELYNEIQFSFHNPTISDDLFKTLRKKSAKDGIKWDGVRKQKCAPTIFHHAVDVAEIYGSSIDIKNIKDSQEYNSLKEQITSGKLKGNKKRFYQSETKYNVKETNSQK